LFCFCIFENIKICEVGSGGNQELQLLLTNNIWKLILLTCFEAHLLSFFFGPFHSFFPFFLPSFLALPSLVQQICMSGGLAISIAASDSRLRRRRHPQIFCQQPWLPPHAPTISYSFILHSSINQY
jgi:hypothetical protein